MSRFNAIPRFTHSAEFVGEEWVKPVLITAVAAIAIAAALLGDVRHSQVYADSPTETRASQSSADASQALRRYTLQLLNILSDESAANKWARYWQAKARCDVPSIQLDNISAGNGVGRLDRALMELNEALCGGLERRLVVNPGDYPLPDDNRAVGLLVNEPEAMGGYTLIAGVFNNYVHLIDHLGRVAHSWQGESRIPHARLLDNGNLLVAYGGGSATVDGIAELDPDGNVVWRYTHPERLHHDFLMMPNGNALILASGIKPLDEVIAAGADPAAFPSEISEFEYDYLIEVRPTGSEGGEIVWEWAAWDYIMQDFDPNKPNYGDPAEHPELIDINFLLEQPRWIVLNDDEFFPWDWLHINGIDYNPELDQIMLSAKHFHELWIIDHSVSTEEAPTRKGGNAGKGGALLYRWGNPRAYGHGTAVDQRLFQSHHTQWVAPGLPGEGNILVFNNGDEAWDVQRRYSSIEEITPPVDGYEYLRASETAYSPVETTWTYTAETPTDFYSTIMGLTQRLPNGNTLIGKSTSGNLFQVTPDGKLVWQYVYPMDKGAPLKRDEEASMRAELGHQDVLLNNAVYRAYWYAPDHPGLRKYDLTPGDTIEIYE